MTVSIGLGRVGSHKMDPWTTLPGPRRASGSLVPMSPHSERHVDRFNRFSTTHVRVQQTDKRPDRPPYRGNNRPHLIYPNSHDKTVMSVVSGGVN